MGKQADGRYRSKVVVGKRADGRNIVKWIQGTTKKELEQNRQRILAEYRDGVAVEESSVLATEWIQKYFDVQVRPNQKPSTADGVQGQINNYILPALRDKQLRAVTAFDLQAIMNGLAGKSKTLTSNVKHVLKGAFSAAYSQGVISRDVSTALYSRPRAAEKRRALTDRETAAVEKALSERTTEPLMLSLFYYTGMRRGEVLGLKWSDVDFKKEVIHVRRDLDVKTKSTDTLKTPAAKRDIPMTPELKQILTEYRGIGSGYVLQLEDGSPLGSTAFKRHFAKIQELLLSDEDAERRRELRRHKDRERKNAAYYRARGKTYTQRPVPEGADKAPDLVTPHYFRHNFATVLYDAGIDVLSASRVMGHADTKTTLSIYTDIANSRRVASGLVQIKNAFSSKVAEKLPDDTASGK